MKKQEGGRIASVRVTPRGIALVDAIKEGLIPECEGGKDDSAFNRFWDKVEVYMIPLNLVEEEIEKAIRETRKLYLLLLLAYAVVEEIIDYIALTVL